MMVFYIEYSGDVDINISNINNATISYIIYSYYI